MLGYQRVSFANPRYFRYPDQSEVSVPILDSALHIDFFLSLGAPVDVWEFEYCTMLHSHVSCLKGHSYEALKLLPCRVSMCSPTVKSNMLHGAKRNTHHGGGRCQRTIDVHICCKDRLLENIKVSHVRTLYLTIHVTLWLFNIAMV